MLKDSRYRVRAMALVHERLSQSENLADIALGEYVERLCADLRNSYLVHSKGVEIEVEVADVSLDADRAIPCGLIINELVSNAFDHGFQNGSDGTISVHLKRVADGRPELIVGDDGIGMPPDLDLERPPTLGLQLVDALVGQLNGTMELDRSNGTRIAILFEGGDRPGG